MTYRGRVQQGVVVLEGSNRPAEGAIVRVEEDEASEAEVGKELDLLAGKAQGLPADLAQRHDHYRSRKKPRRLGTLAGSVQYIAPDFDAPLDDFAEYMK